MTDLNDIIDIASLPSVSLAERRRLPEDEGVYFVVDALDQCVYVGKSVNLRTRWACHQKLPLFSSENGVFRIAWLITENAVAVERRYIRLLKPRFNIVVAPQDEPVARRDGRKPVAIILPSDILAEYDALLLKQYKVGGKRSQHILGMIEACVAEHQLETGL